MSSSTIEEYEPTSAKKLFKIYQRVHEQVFVKKVRPYFFRSDEIQEIFQKLSRILTNYLIDPEIYITVQMTALHDYLMKKRIKFHPNMLVSNKALSRYNEAIKKTRDHGNNISTEAISSVTGYQELYNDLSISEGLFGSEVICLRIAGEKIEIDLIIKSNVTFLGEAWLVHFKDDIILENYIDDFNDERLEIIEQLIRSERSNSYRSNVVETLKKARSNTTDWILRRWISNIESDIDIDCTTLMLDPLSYWWSVCNFIIYRLSMLPEEVKRIKLNPPAHVKNLPSYLGQSWSNNIESRI